MSSRSDGNKKTLNVVISAGQPRDRITRVREVACFIHGLTPYEVEHGILLVFDKEDSKIPMKRIPLKDNVAERYRDSIHVFTGLFFEATSWTPANFMAGTIGYFSEVRVDNQLVVQGQLELQPRWMEKLMPTIGRLLMFDLAVPATHDSGTYKRYTGQNLINRYRDCQEENVFTQLLYGVRAIDLRPAAVAKSSSPYNGYEYWIYHDIFPTKNSLETILTDIRQFLDIFVNEVVFVDFHEFPIGFKHPDAFEGLAKLVNTILGDLVYPRNVVSPMSQRLRDVIALGHRAIVTYEKNSQLRMNYLPGIEHLWANTDKLAKLQDYIQKNVLACRYERMWFFNAMSQITAQGMWNVIIDKYRGGVRGIAHQDNFRITTWYRYDTRLRDAVNLVAFDYVTSTDIVELCKEINIERAQRHMSFSDYTYDYST